MRSKSCEQSKASHVEILAMQEVSSGLLDRLHDAGIEDYLPYSVSSATHLHDNGGVNVLYSAASSAGNNAGSHSY